MIFDEKYFYIYGLPKLCQLGKRRAPTNSEESFNEISKIMDMRPMSIKKHECIFANIVPISITKHKMCLFAFSKFDNFGVIFLGPEQSSSHKVFVKNGFCDGGILVNWGDLKTQKI